MATPLLPNALWDLLEPFLPTPSPKAEGHVCQIALASGASCSFCEAVADAAAGDELWFGDELLATVARLAGGSYRATDPLRFIGLAGALRPD
jgi:hypothetical protein